VDKIVKFWCGQNCKNFGSFDTEHPKSKTGGRKFKK